MYWDKLICDKRYGMEQYQSTKQSIRSDFQRDYDRLIFSSPFRRLQNKTQVFPLPGSVFVHNRLTHSLEVSSVGKSMARGVANILYEKYKEQPWRNKLRYIDEIVSAACLAHDLGNPPFGHSGEKSISTFYSEGIGESLKEHLTIEQWNDLIHFEGNANSFRLLAHQFRGRRSGGFAMTYSTLASFVKYPYSSSLAYRKGKFGFFTSEAKAFADIANEIGLIQLGDNEYTRHPLVYLVEAADDICYQVMDLEDAQKLKIVSADEVIKLLLNFFTDKKRCSIEENMQHLDDNNEKIAYLRSSVIGALVDACALSFVKNEQAILSGKFQGTLIENIPTQLTEAYNECSAVARERIYCAADVVDIDIAGNQIITFLMERLTNAILNPEKNTSHMLLHRIPQQYDMQATELFERVQAVNDYVSGMTDIYALDLYRKLNGMSLPAV
ncbi:MAG: deoxyguanosinetriphosphate triphosphohydrolase [Bacteroidales bacterium]